MAYNPSLGLLGDQQSLAPSLGLLGRLGNPGEDPIQAALAQMAAQRAQMAPGQGVGAPGAFVPPTPPSQAGGAPGPSAAAPAPPAPAPATRRPLLRPAQAALFAAGGELAREDAPSLAHAVSRALAAGVPAFLTSKQAERDQAEADAKEREFRGQVDDMVGRKLIGPTTAAVARTMTSDDGRKFIAEMHKRGRQTTALKPEDRLVADDTGELIAEGAAPQPDAPSATTDIKEFIAGVPFPGPSLKANDFESWPEAAKMAFREWQRARENDRVSRTSVTTNVMPPGARSLTDTAAGNAADILTADFTKVRAGEVALTSLERIEGIMQQPTFLGAFADEKTGLAKAANSLFGTRAGLGKAQATEAIRAHVENVVIPRLEEMGARPSDEDLKALRRTIGETSYTSATLGEIVRLQRNMIERRMSDYNQDWTAIAEQYRGLGAQLPANLRPVGPNADAIRVWALLSAAEREELLRSGVPDPTRFTPLPPNRIPRR